MERVETWLAARAETNKERRKVYERYLTTVSGLAPLERAAAWLSHVVDQRERFGDLEALVFLASRGHDITNTVRQVIKEWKEVQKDAIAAYNKGRQERGASILTINDVASTAPIGLRGFWWSRPEQEHSIDATMLRVVEWCQIGGFEHWWKRLTREAMEEVTWSRLGVVSRALWLFAMCRSDYAVKQMPKVLQRALDIIAMPQTDGLLPWQIYRKDEVLRKPMIVDSVPCASAIVFAEHLLHYETDCKDEAIAAINRHFDNGSWSRWTDETTPSVEITAMAMHALGVAQPMGWEHTMAEAGAWLMTKQREGGYWEEEGTPGPEYLTVLVLDALSLATQPAGALTFRLQAATTSSHDDPMKPSQPPVPVSAAELTWESSAEERKAAVDDYIQEAWEKTSKKIYRKSIWLQARYESATEFERWQRKDPRTTRNVHERFVRILIDKPHLKPKQ
jgi:hypothetical protein